MENPWRTHGGSVDHGTPPGLCSAPMGNLFDSTGFMPHGHCYLWRPALVALHVGSDVLIAAAYFVIPALMLSFLRKRRDVPLRPVFGAFALFIISCGTSHVMEIVTLWSPHYWASGAVKAMTAVASLGTVMMLIPAVPRAVALPSPEQLRRANDQLARTALELQLHQLVLQQMKLGVLLIRARDGVVVFANPRAETLFDFVPGTLAGIPARELLENPDTLSSAFEDAAPADGVEERQVQLTWKTRAGASIWTQATLSSVSHPVHGLVRVARLRDRREVERSLLADIVQTTSEAVVAVDVTGQVRTWNVGAERLYGYSEQEAVGRPFEALTGTPARYPTTDAPLVHEAQHTTRAGQRKDVVVTVTPVKGADGALVAISKLVHDVTERREAERALASSLKDKEVLLQEVHHRVKNNLQLVSSLLRIQSESVTGDESRAAFVELQGRVRAIAMLHEVLYQTTKISNVPLEDYVRRLLQSVARVHQRPGVDARLDVTAPRLEVKMEASVPLALVLNELFVNVFKHGLEAGSLTASVAVRAVPDGERLRVEVEDNGKGLRGDFSLEAHAGVGLRLVQSLLRQLRGTLRPEAVTQGTRWVIDVPREGVLS
jgi:PAS domain S-box-containing protein